MKVTNVLCLILACTSLCLAADFSSLPSDAQKAIRRKLASRNAAVEHFTFTASDGSDNSGFGVSVAISGNTAVVGGALLNENGAVVKTVAYVFVKPASGWKDMTQTAELTASDGEPTDEFARSLAVSGDTVIVGASSATINGNADQGAAYVFVKPQHGWANMTETAKLTASDGAAYAYFGASTAIGGNTVVVGAPAGIGENPGPGRSYVFVEPEGGWKDMSQTAELTASDGQQYDDFGDSVSISANTIAVGSPQDGFNGDGAAYVFVEPPGGWSNTTETAELNASDGTAGDLFGWSISFDGKTSVVGCRNAAYVFVESAGGWSDMTQTAKLTDGSVDGVFGTSVAISGTAIAVGAPDAHNFSGAAFLFIKPTGGWHDTSAYNRELGIPFSYGDDLFGTALAVSGTEGILGAPAAPSSPPCKKGQCQAGPGEAFLFVQQ